MYVITSSSGSREDQLVWRPGQGRTVEIFDIVVNSERRRGRGREMVESLKQCVPPSTALIYAITRLSNTIAHEFYESLGFRIVGRLHNFYRESGDETEHAMVYGLDL